MKMPGPPGRHMNHIKIFVLQDAIVSLFSTHPPTDERIVRLEAIARSGR